MSSLELVAGHTTHTRAEVSRSQSRPWASTQYTVVVDTHVVFLLPVTHGALGLHTYRCIQSFDGGAKKLMKLCGCCLFTSPLISLKIPSILGYVDHTILHSQHTITVDDSFVLVPDPVQYSRHRPV